MSDEKPTNWWATLPGLLTAAAAVITAVTGLLLGLGQLGVFDGGRPATVATGGSPSATASASGAGTASASASRSGQGAKWTVALPAERTYQTSDVEYQLLDARARADVDGKVALTFSVRCTNHGKYDVNFWDSTFRVDAGGVSQAPYSGLDEVVSGDSSKTGEISFMVPAETRDQVLRIKFPEGERTVAVTIAPGA
jgi:hypothetical protein